MIKIISSRPAEASMSELHEAASVGDLITLEDALKRGLNVNEPDVQWDSRTPLHVACLVGQKNCTYVLLKAGANPNCLTSSGRTPAHFACEAGMKSYFSTCFQGVALF